MRTLILEDDFTSQILLDKLLEPYSERYIVSNGPEAVEAFERARSIGEPYHLVCLDIMVPEMNGQEVLQKIRALEDEQGIFPGNGAKVLMTTALNDGENVMTAFRKLCDGYLVKPIDKTKLLRYLQQFGLIK